jgi:hypothetical protein
MLTSPTQPALALPAAKMPAIFIFLSALLSTLTLSHTIAAMPTSHANLTSRADVHLNVNLFKGSGCSQYNGYLRFYDDSIGTCQSGGGGYHSVSTSEVNQFFFNKGLKLWLYHNENCATSSLDRRFELTNAQNCRQVIQAPPDTAPEIRSVKIDYGTLEVGAGR